MNMSDRAVQGSVAIDVQGLHKSFRMRTADRRNPRGLRIRPKGYHVEDVSVLDGISFDVRHGELFGVVGRNGSGKSTLLKILSRIYTYDRGSVAISGRLAPFIHLGIGFHPELTAWDNVRTNAVMMGLSPREARERFEQILDFAELDDFRGMELKNYSSGMQMRLAFATMLEVDADVFLIDEILSVGDARFRDKCARAFADLRTQGKTIVMVSHSLADIKSCDRAMSIHDGRVGRIGDPEEVTAHYLEHQKAGRTPAPASKKAQSPTEPALAIERVWLEDSAGKVAGTVPRDEALSLHAMVASLNLIRGSIFVTEVHDETGAVIAALDAQPLGGADRRMRPGERIHVVLPLPSLFQPGTYFAVCRALRAGRAPRETPIAESQALSFEVTKVGRTMPPPAGDGAPNHPTKPTVPTQ